ncbi:adenosylcobalamin-dependent ribonucleoside-diphosphate reductase [Deinococcus pimensis]|uniref:adenosylcobalamin-dependent ribonucleoside-diphosphate reductase n=1 Tax=Deinococcus pimensis TaxID=309888 RepID=UPI0004B76B32|nr:adenosylcobalamin-dependent ribonucleoside-diphosphate reductase [Deinococcus pimensis]
MTTPIQRHPLTNFDENAHHIGKRQYLQPGDGDLGGLFERVANWVAGAEQPEARARWSQAFYDLMADKKFCPGGRVLAGAGTQHGNVLNCFVQGATESDPSAFEGIMEVARKLALVTKVGGGNGVNLDVYTPRAHTSRPDAGVRGWAYMSVTHPDVHDFVEGLMRPPTQPDGEKQPTSLRNWTRVVYGASVPADLVALARAHGVTIVRGLPDGVLPVPDDMGGIIDAAAHVAEHAKLGLEPRIDISGMRQEGAPIKGSGGTSSGPVSFLVEIFDNFIEWANRGAETSGPINTLRYVYAPVLRVVRQGGCLHPDTLVHTSHGTLRLRELVDTRAFGHQGHALEVATDEGWRHSPEGFNNGHADTLKVRLESGLALQGTPNHKLKVLREDGTREWVRFDALRPGDWVIQVLDQHTGAPVLLEPLDDLHFNTKRIRTPDRLSEELAFWLGYLWGDGFVSGNRVGFAVTHGSPMMQEGPRLFRDLFGLEMRVEQKDNDRSVVFVTRSTALVRWLELNGLLKGKASDLEVPRSVRQAPRPVLGAFLRGLFEADGTLLHGYPQLSTASRRFAEDVVVLLGGLGIPAKLTRYGVLANRYSDREHFRLNVVSAKGLERFVERVGWLSDSRFEALATFTPDQNRESAWPLPHAAGLLSAVHAALPAGRKSRPSPFTETRKTLSRYIRGERGLTASGYSSLLRNPQIANVLPTFDHDEYYTRVLDVTPGERILTLDICVDENHTYLANGLVSHNTRRGAGMATISIAHPDVLDFLTAKDLDREAAEGDISTFNISILVDEAFWRTLEQDGLWPVRAQDVPGKYHLSEQTGTYDGTLPELPDRAEDGARGVPTFGGAIPAKWLWQEIARHAWSTGEPGLIFVDRINEYSALKDLGERYQIRSTNPCGEIPLTVGEPCDLGAINLAAYVRGSEFDYAEFRADVRTCVRFLDDVLDVNVFALEDNREASQSLRRLGLGVMGLADALIKMGLRYDNEAGRDAIYEIMSVLREEAIAESERLGEERGVYRVYQQNAAKIPHEPRRNVAVLTVAPTGTTSMLMGVSSGIEPVFSPFIWRKIGSEYRALLHPLFVELLETYPPAGNMEKDGHWDWDKVTEAVSGNHGSVQGLEFIPQALRAVFVCAHDIKPVDHVRMQGAVQRAFDAQGYAANSLSKTINLPNEATVEDVQDAYAEAYRTGCKGITVYRDGSRQFQVLSTSKKKEKKTQEAAEVMGEAAETTAAPAAQTTAAPAYKPGRPVYERPARLSGITDMVKLTDPTSGHRRSFLVTVNHLNGRPVEVMVISGRAGDEANADSEALGRVVSIALQYGVPAEALIKTMRGINGGLYGSYNGRLVGSKADLIAVALETFAKGEVTLPPLAGGSGDLPEVPLVTADAVSAEGVAGSAPCPVCEARALVREEGCVKCQACGYSKCG